MTIECYSAERNTAYIKMKMAGYIPATHVHPPQMIRFGFDGLYGYLKRIKTYVQYIITMFAQNNDHFWTGEYQAYEVSVSVMSNMIGFGSIQ